MSTQYVIAVLITLTASASYLNHRFIKLPKSIGLTVITLLFSLGVLLLHEFGFDLTTTVRSLLDGIDFTETVMDGMISFLLFAGALHINLKELARYKWIVSTLTTCGVLISALLVGGLTFVVSHALGFSLSFVYCLVFGALISPTDPIAVLGILKTLHAPRNLEMKLAGEALFNDGLGIVLFVLFVEVATGDAGTLTFSGITLAFLRQTVGGIMLGGLLGVIVARMLRDVSSFDVAVLITLALVTGGYLFADAVADVSGPISMVIAGLIIGNACHDGKMSALTEKRLDGFWELLDEVLNAILFALIGMEVLDLTLHEEGFYLALCIVPIVLLSRFISVAVSFLALRKVRRFSLDTIGLMTWGGLRGGVSIALALSLPHSDDRQAILSMTYAVVIFSIIVQGLTIKPLVKRYAAQRQDVRKQNKLDTKTNGGSDSQQTKDKKPCC